LFFVSKLSWKSVALGFLIVLLTATAYWPALRCGFIWDDDDYVTRNSTLRDLPGLGRIWFEVGSVPQYYPLVHTTFWLEYHLWGLKPSGYHLTNILLHTLAAMLLWRALVRLRLNGAWLAAAVFAIHPVFVESVAWITERKNVLAAVFYFGAALAYWRFSGPEDDRGSRSGRWRWYWLALLFFVGALWSKTVACSLPAALLLARWWKQGLLRWKDVLPLGPFFAAGALLGILTLWLEKHHVGAQGVDWSLSLTQRCLIATRALWFYAGKLVWPNRLTFIYPRWRIDPAIWWQWLFPAAIIGLLAALWFWRRRLGRGPLAALLFFCGTLLPALGFVDVYPMRFSFVADHFQYMAAVSLIVLGVQPLARLPGSFRWISVVLLLALGVTTWQRIGAYRDVETLWRDTLAKNPGCWLAHNNLGVVLDHEGKPEQAEAEFRAAVELNPAFAEALNSLGGHLCGNGRVTEGIEYCRAALEINPRYENALFNLGAALAGQGQQAEAIRLLEAALQIRPRDVDARRALGDALTRSGKVDQAVGQYRLALQSEPEDARVRYALGLALALQGNWDEAIDQDARAVRSMPNDAEAQYNLGYALRVRSRLDEAATHLGEALRLRPAFPLAQYNLGCVLADQGLKEEAVKHLREALRLKPDYVDARQKLLEQGAPVEETPGRE
jgi:tetratricopeptide (TPR) repeat protein